MQKFYLIEQPESKLYVHFNPHTDEYFASAKVLGAALFNKSKGNNFINMALDNSWQLTESNPKLTTRSSRDKEADYFNETH